MQICISCRRLNLFFNYRWNGPTCKWIVGHMTSCTIIHWIHIYLCGGLRRSILGGEWKSRFMNFSEKKRRNSTHEWGLGTVASFGWTPDLLFLYDRLGPWLQITRCEYSIECYAKQMNHCRNCEHDRPSLFWLPIKIEINVRYYYWLNKFNWVRWIRW